MAKIPNIPDFLIRSPLLAEKHRFSRFEAWLTVVRMLQDGVPLPSLRKLSEQWQWSHEQVRKFLDELPIYLNKELTILLTNRRQKNRQITNCDTASTKDPVDKRIDKSLTKELTPKKVSNADIKKRAFQEETESCNGVHSPRYINFRKWLTRECPFIIEHFETYITDAQFFHLIEMCGDQGQMLCETIKKINNRKDLRKKYSDLYTTCYNWIKNEQNKVK